MAKRALGALLALAAAVAFVVAIVTSAWWSGHPIVDGRAISAKDVHVGLLGAEGCNTGGDGSCEAVEIGGTLRLASYAELAAIALAALLAFLTAIAAWRVADNRKGLSRASMLATLLAAAGGAVVVVLGPAIKASSSVEVPLGYGLFIFGGAIISSLVASAITRGIEPEPLRLKPSNAPLFPPAQPDIRQMIAQTSAEPAPRDSASLFNAAPQLRPLYDPNNAGVAPAPVVPHLPTRAPTPMPQDQIERLTGKASPRVQSLVAPAPPAHELDWSAPPTQTPAPQPWDGPAPYGVPQSPMGGSSSSPYGGPQSPVGGSSSAPYGSPQSPMGGSSSSPYGSPQSPIGGPRSKPMTAPPPPPGSQSSSRTAVPPGSQSSSRTTAPPPPLAQSSSQSSSRTAVPPNSQSSSRTTAPPPLSQSSSRTAAMGAQPPSTPGSQSSSRNASPSVPPVVRPIVPAPGPRVKPPTASPGSASTRDKPTTTPPSTSSSKAASTTAPPGTSSSMGASTKSPVGSAGAKQPRGQTISSPGATPPPERHSTPGVARPRNTSESPPRQPTVAHAVPPMPRASTDNDDRLDVGMRETEYNTAVEIDHEAKARAQHAHAHRPATEDVRTGGNRIVGDVTDANIAAPSNPNIASAKNANIATATDANIATATDASIATANNAAITTTTDEEAVEATEIGAAPAPPALTRLAPAHKAAPAPTQGPTPARIDEPSDEAAFDASATAEEAPKIDLNATMVDNHTPVPTLSRPPTSQLSTETPIPTRSNVPLSTAPSSLPPPKSMDPVPSGPTPACPQCESPMAWVDEHLRFYCRSCRMYF